MIIFYIITNFIYISKNNVVNTHMYLGSVPSHNGGATTKTDPMSEFLQKSELLKERHRLRLTTGIVTVD